MLVVLVLTLIMYSENDHFAAIEDKVFLCSPFVDKAQQCLAEADPLLKSRAFMCTFILQY